MIARMRKLPALAGVVLFAAGCRGSAERESVSQLTATLELRLDADSLNLSPISWIAVARDGNIAVSQQQDGNVRFFDHGGGDLGTFGRRGGGPGEFQWIGNHGWLADTLFVLDPQARRLTLVSPARTLLRTLPWPTTILLDADPSTPEPHFFWVLPVALYADGSMLTSPMMTAGDSALRWPGGKPTGDPLVRIDSDDQFLRIIATRPDDPCQVRVMFKGGSGSFPIPFCFAPLIDFAADGSRIATVIPGARSSSSGDASYRLIVVQATGDTALARDYTFTPIHVPADTAESVLAQRLKTETRQEWIDAYRSLKAPDTYPPLSRILVGRDDTIWLETYSRAGDRIWRVLGPDGESLGDVAVPRNVNIIVASRDAFWGTDTDENDLASVVRYRISR